MEKAFPYAVLWRNLRYTENKRMDWGNKERRKNRMKWEDICQAFPNRWVLIEAVDAYTNEDNKRILTDFKSDCSDRSIF